MKTLNTIQTLSKIGRIFSKIIFIFSIIGAAGCAVGMACLPFADIGIIKIGSVTVYGLIANKADIQLQGLYSPMAGAMIVCIGQAILAKFAQSYFTHELAAGNPFTSDGANEMRRLGILCICISIAAQILSQIVSSIIAEFAGSCEMLKLDGGDSIAIGIMFIVMSQLCKYGSELTQKQEENS